MQAGDHSIQRIQTEQLMVLGTITSGLTSTTVVLMLQVDWSHQVDVKHPVLVLRIESPQIHIPNGVDVLKLCFKIQIQNKKSRWTERQTWGRVVTYFG